MAISIFREVEKLIASESWEKGGDNDDIDIIRGNILRGYVVETLLKLLDHTDPAIRTIAIELVAKVIKTHRIDMRYNIPLVVE